MGTRNNHDGTNLLYAKWNSHAGRIKCFLSCLIVTHIIYVYRRCDVTKQFHYFYGSFDDERHGPHFTQYTLTYSL